MRNAVLLLLVLGVGCSWIDPDPDLVKRMAYEVYMEDPINSSFENGLMKDSGISEFEHLWRFHENYRSRVLGHDTVMWEWEQEARRRLRRERKVTIAEKGKGEPR